MVITTSGSIASFKTPVKQPLKSLKVYFSPIQNGTGDPSSTNVRSIDGWTGLVITRCGKNLYDPSTYKFTDGYYIAGGTGSRSEGSGWKSTAGFYPLNGLHGTVTLNSRPGGSNPGIAFYSSPKVAGYISGYKNEGNASGKKWTFEIPNGAKYMRFTVPSSTMDVQIEYGSTATAYEPYSGTTIPIDWSSEAGTLYGGYMDLISGELVATHKIVSYVGDNSEQWTRSSGINRYYINANDAEILAFNTRHKVVSNIGMFKTSGGDSYTVFVYQLDANSNKLIFYYPPSSITDVLSFKQWLSENNMQVCYKLATPIIYQISPIQLETLIGRNNIFSDGDTVEAVYDHVDAMDMVRLRQKVLKGCQIYKTVLPPGYREYDYLQTVGHNAKINTGISGADATLAMDFEHMLIGKGSTYGSYYGLLGNGDPSSGEMYWCIRRYLHSGDTNFTKWGYCNLGNSTNSRSIRPCGAENTIIDKRIHYTLRFGELTTVCNGQTVTAQTETQNNVMYDSPIFIGTTSATSSGIASTIGRFYGHFKIWSGGTLIREYIPAVRLSDNKAGFYDLVNYTFSPSIGSADFVAGNDIGGLYVYADNSRYYEYVDDTVDANVTTDSDYFLTGFYDTGSDAAKSYTVPVLVPDGHVCVRLFNDKAASSVDYFNISTSYDTRTYTGPGRYIMATVYKPRAADFYIYDNTNQRYIVKGSNVT